MAKTFQKILENDSFLKMRFTVRRIYRLWHKIIGRLFELKAVDGSEQRDLRLIMQIIVHMEMCPSVFIIVTAQAAACDKALKVLEYKLDDFSIKSLCRLDNGKRYSFHMAFSINSRSRIIVALLRLETADALKCTSGAICVSFKPLKK